MNKDQIRYWLDHMVESDLYSIDFDSPEFESVLDDLEGLNIPDPFMLTMVIDGLLN